MACVVQNTHLEVTTQKLEISNWTHKRGQHWGHSGIWVLRNYVQKKKKRNSVQKTILSRGRQRTAANTVCVPEHFISENKKISRMRERCIFWISVKIQILTNTEMEIWEVALSILVMRSNSKTELLSLMYKPNWKKV